MIATPSRRPLLVGGGLAVLLALLFPETLFLGRIFFERDIQLLYYPHVPVFQHLLAEGSWPLWEPYIGFGHPMVANSGAQVFYPPNYLKALLPPGPSYTVYVFLHLFLAGLGAYRLARAVGASRAGAMVGAAQWTLSGPLLSMVNLLQQLASSAWMPWVLLAALRTLREPRAGHAAAWGLLAAVQLLAGSPDLCVLTALTAAVLVLAHLRGPGRPSRRRLLGAGLLAAAVAVAVSAAQWAPALELASRSSRWSLPAEMRTFWSLPPAAVAQMFAPVFFERLPLRDEERGALLEGRDPLLASIYLGAGALALAGGAFQARPRTARFLVGVLALALLVALGRHTPVYGLLSTVVPVVRMLRYPVRFLIAGALAFSLLAALGFDGWRAEAPGRRRVALLAPGALAALLALLFGCAFGLAPDEVGASWLHRESFEASFREWLAPSARLLAMSGGSGLLAAGLLALRSRVPMAVAAAAALALADLYAVHRTINPTAPGDLLAWRPPVLEVLERERATRLFVHDYFAEPDGGVARLGRPATFLSDSTARLPPGVGVALALRSTLFPPIGGGWGLRGSYATDFTGLAPREAARLLEFVRAAAGTPYQVRMLRLGAVSHVLARHRAGFEGLVHVQEVPSLYPEPVQVYRVPSPLPRAIAVGGARIGEGNAAYAAFMDAAFDPSREVVLPEGGPRPAPPDFRGQAQIVADRGDHVAIEAALSHPGWVVLADAHDPGWRVLVDGSPARLLRANVGFRAVEVPAGRHHIEHEYRPRSLGLGLVASALGLGCGAVLLIARPRRIDSN